MDGLTLTLGVWGAVLVVCVCVSVSGVLFSVGVCVCVCDLLIVSYQARMDAWPATMLTRLGGMLTRDELLQFSLISWSLVLLHDTQTCPSLTQTHPLPIRQGWTHNRLYNADLARPHAIRRDEPRSCLFLIGSRDTDIPISNSNATSSF